MTAAKSPPVRRGSRWVSTLQSVTGWIVAIVVALGVAYGLGVARAPDLPAEAPDFDLPTIDGGRLRLSELRGRPVVLNFWATWCGPCQVEIPAFARFAERNPETFVLGVVAPEPLPTLRASATDLGATYPVAVADDAVLAAYGITVFPTTIVVDREGRVATSHTGIMLDPQLWWATRGL